MTREDVLFYIAVIGAPAAVLSCLYQIISYHWPRATNSVSPPVPTPSATRPIWINAIIALVVCIAVGTDYYDRHFNHPPTVPVSGWGANTTANEAAFYVLFDSSPIQSYASNYKLILLVRGISLTLMKPLTRQ
jgi:hypothetical protein